MNRQDNFGGRFGKGSMVKEPARTQPEKITIDSTQLQERMGCRLKRSADLTLVTATPTLVPWDTAIYVRSGIWVSTANTRITIPTMGRVTGQWWFHTTILWEPGNAGGRFVQIQHNGSPIAVHELPGLNATFTETCDLSCLVNDPKPGDYFQVQVEHSQGSDIDVDDKSYFECVHLW